jgi:hypothetical protein
LLIFTAPEFMPLLESIGFDEGGQLPFYYNRRTGQAVCGATTYANLRKWGKETTLSIYVFDTTRKPFRFKPLKI